ncbi:MAG: OmpA family protein [Verrucomicrobiota bacterium]|nr:OmpA family protein [Verrucomicrobiota bacterium]
MTKRTFLSAAVCGLGLVLGAGCASDDASQLNPEGIGADAPLPVRGALGELIASHPLQSQTIYFDYDSARIKDSETPKIQAAAKHLIENFRVQCELEGHCDERGSGEYNMSLGERRAQAVRAGLIGFGIEASKLHTKSFGEEKPIDPEHDESAWRKNRRVEFALYK